MPCSMVACSEQGGLDDKATDADGVFAVSSGPGLALPDQSARWADIMEAEDAALGPPSTATGSAAPPRVLPTPQASWTPRRRAHYGLKARPTLRRHLRMLSTTLRRPAL